MYSIGDAIQIDTAPLWLPDGRRLLFASTRGGMPNVYSQAADVTGSAEQLLDGPAVASPSTISRDGKIVVVTQASATPNLMTLAPGRDRHLRPLIRSSAVEGQAALSPDGRWLAYNSCESGTVHVHVRPFPDVDAARWQVSTGGGQYPLWAKGGEELFFVDLNGAVMSMRVSRGPIWKASPPQQVLEPRYFLPMGGGRNYDVSPDGQRFLLIKSAEGPSLSPTQSLVVVQNWFDEVRRLVGGQAASAR